VDEIARLLPISRSYPSFLDENTQIWMNKGSFIHNLDVSSTHMDEGGSYTVVKIASALILIIEKKITGEHTIMFLKSIKVVDDISFGYSDGFR
jgi:hypothetical protein